LIKKLMLSFTALVVSLVVAEVVVRLFFPPVLIGPSFCAFDPVYGKVVKKDYRCQRITPEYAMQFSSNSLGFRGPEPATTPREGVLVLGDSFAMGYGVDDGQEFPSLVAGALARRHGAGTVPVVNTAMSCNGNGRWVKFLRDEASRYAPRLVVLQACTNDFWDNTTEGLFSLSPSGELVELPIPEPDWRRRVQETFDAVPGLSYSRLVCLVREQIGVIASDGDGDGGGGGAGGGESTSLPEELTYALIERSLAICKEHGWPTVLIAARFKEDNPWLERLTEMCAAFEVPLLRIPTKSEQPPLYYELDGHWNPAGHAYVANLLMDHLTDHGTLADIPVAGQRTILESPRSARLSLP